MPQLNEVVLPTNNFVDVVSYNMANLEFFRNMHPNLKYANGKYMNFQNMPGQLGTVVTWELPPRVIFNQGSLSIDDNAWDSTEQRFHTHKTTEKGNVNAAVDAEQQIYNDADDYMERIGKASMIVMANGVEANIVQNYLNSFRFFRFDDSSLLTYTNVASAIAMYKNYGYASGQAQYMFIPDILMPQFIKDGLGQFAQKRNDVIANSWEIGDITGTKVLSAQILPEHVAGAGAQAGDVLTLESVSLDGTTLTFSGCSVDTTQYFVAGDLFEFRNDTAALTLKYLFFNNGGNAILVSANNVQCKVDEDAESIAGEVTVKINNTFGFSLNDGGYPLVSDPTSKKFNLSRPLVPTVDQIDLVGNHRAGLLCDAQTLFLSMPQLPNESPYASSNAIDPDSGLSIRLTYGSAFGRNFKGFIWSILWGSSLIGERSMRLIFPSNPGALPLDYHTNLLKEPRDRKSIKTISQLTQERAEIARRSRNYVPANHVSKRGHKPAAEVDQPSEVVEKED